MVKFSDVRPRSETTKRFSRRLGVIPVVLLSCTVGFLLIADSQRDKLPKLGEVIFASELSNYELQLTNSKGKIQHIEGMDRNTRLVVPAGNYAWTAQKIGFEPVVGHVTIKESKQVTVPTKWIAKVDEVELPADNGWTQRDVMRWLLDTGARLEVTDHGGKTVLFQGVGSVPPEDDQAIEGIAFLGAQCLLPQSAALHRLSLLPRVKSITLQQVHLEDLSWLIGIRGLTKLTVVQCQMNSADRFACVRQMRDLEELSVYQTAMTEVDLRLLEPLPKLHSLKLVSAGLTDSAWAPIARCGRLKVLDVSQNYRITGKGMAELQTLHELRQLRLGKMYLDLEQKHVWPSWPMLERLLLDECVYPSDFLESMAKCPKLHVLDLSHQNISLDRLHTLNRFQALGLINFRGACFEQNALSEWIPRQQIHMIEFYDSNATLWKRWGSKRLCHEGISCVPPTLSPNRLS